MKQAKRIIRDHLQGDGTLDTSGFVASLLRYRNTPDKDSDLSPAQVLFGRRLRDFLPITPGQLQLHPQWLLTLKQREEALAKRHSRRAEELTEHTRELSKLRLGDTVCVQDQSGNHPKRWNRTGVIVEVQDHNKYVVKIHGSGRATTRNRKYLKPITPYEDIFTQNKKVLPLVREKRLHAQSSTPPTEEKTQKVQNTEQAEENASARNQEKPSGGRPQAAVKSRELPVRERRSPDFYQAGVASTGGDGVSGGCPMTQQQLHRSY